MDITHKISPRAKRITLRIRGDGTVVVTRPKHCPKILAQTFARTKRDWITHKLQAQEKTNTLTLDEINTLRKKAKAYLPNRTQELAQKHGITIGNVTIRHQSTRWWSCSSRNTISLNCELMRLPQELCDYVILHELAHVRHKHHQTTFWEYLEHICPESKKKDRELKEYTLGRKYNLTNLN